MTKNRLRNIVYLLIGLVLVYIVAREPFRRWMHAAPEVGPIPGIVVKNTHVDSPLCVAVEAGDLASVTEQLDHGADVQTIGFNGMPLEEAISRKQPAIARLLLDRGADPNRYRYISPLHLASFSMPQIVPDLLKRGAKVDTWALCAAMRARNLAAANLLVQHGAPVNGPPPSPLGHSSGGPQDTVRRPSPPQSPLAQAACYAPELQKVLMRHGADLGADKETVLIWAALQRRGDLIPRLLDLGADPNGVSAGESPLTQAVLTCPAAVPILLEHGARPNYLTADGRTPLREAAMAGDEKTASLLIAHRADVNFHAEHAHGPLWFARKHQHARVAELLAQAGARED